MTAPIYAPADWAKWERLQDVTRADALDPDIRALSQSLAAVAAGDRRRFVLLAHCVARDWIRYQSDTERTGGEDIAGVTRGPKPGDATEALRRGTDDCDAKARLFVALCLAAGMSAQLEPLWKPGASKLLQLSHVFASVELNGKTVYAETILSRARLGDHPLHVPFEKGTHQWQNS